MSPSNNCQPKVDHVAIVGAGLMGRLTAVSLARAGYQITLIDKDDKKGHQSAAYAAAGLLTPLGEAIHSEASIVNMGFASLGLWPDILSSLSSYTFFQQQGSIAVAHEQDQGDLQRFSRYITHHYQQHCLQKLDRQQLLALEPEISRHFNHGLYLPEEGQIGSRKLLIALAAEISQLSVEWLASSHVSAIMQRDNGARLTINSLTRDFDLVIDCRGAGARKNQAQHAMPLTDLRAVRGEIFQLFAPEVTINRPIRLMHPRYQLYIAPKPNGHYVVGATEIESDDQSPMTVRSAMELLSAAYSVHSGFAEANIRQHVSQLRPAFSDNLPRINIDNRVIHVNGLYRHGFLIAPVVLAQLTHAVEAVIGNKVNTKSPYQHLLPVQLHHEYIH
ncbi:glycine oxidase ThiO [Thalassotalea sediminis]|uniref:glycine oxidase ThiO n=1 Tax=Thalassotalea sediminis TaxID=1759089 RepID=UPI00257462CF|nr:glycine oxidase ThiO [Thalassotalea sediminis]